MSDILTSNWQPIETAPKDGQEILAVRMYEGRCVKMGVSSFGPCRKQHDGYVAGDGEPRWRNQGNEKLFPTPTHWQKLPAPPKGIEI